MPARLSQIKAVLMGLGATLEEPSKGSHWKVRLQGTPMYPIPAHNGLKTEIDDNYIRGLCRNFGFDQRDFFAKLRGE